MTATELSAQMSPAQRDLARRVLGLPNWRAAAERSRTLVDPIHPSHPQWIQMVAAGAAVRTRHFGGPEMFELTRAGAQLALDKGETLDAECFPQSSLEVASS